MRLFLVMLLSFMCIVLPLQASAGMAVADNHCPHMQDMTTPSPADANDRHDCCNDAATVAKTGQLCKTGQECSPSFNYMLPPTLSQLAFTTAVRPLPAIPLRAPTGSPASVWRPPTLV